MISYFDHSCTFRVVSKITKFAFLTASPKRSFVVVVVFVAAVVGGNHEQKTLLK